MTNEHERAEFIRGLREFADFLEEQPELPVFKSQRFDGFVDTVEEFREAADLMGPVVREIAGRAFIEAYRAFPGNVAFAVNIRRETAYPTTRVEPLLGKVKA